MASKIRNLVVTGALLLSSTLFLSGQSATPSYYFSHLAGISIYGSRDGTGSAAPLLYGPVGTAVDSAGNAYVTDSILNVVHKITPSGVISTFAGSPGVVGSADGVGNAARFHTPAGLAIDSANNLYVADSGNGLIRKIAPDGTVTTVEKGITDPEGVAVDAAGNIYVTDTIEGLILKVTLHGAAEIAGDQQSWASTDGTGSSAGFAYPRGIVVDQSGNLYVADWLSGVIRKITPAGVVTTIAGTAYTSGPPDGTGTSAHFANPYGMAIDSAGNLYVTDYTSNTIRKITPSVVVTTIAGGASQSGYVDATGSDARFSAPTGIAVDVNGNLYVADYSNCLLRKISPGGVVTTAAGTTIKAAQFNHPASVTVDGAGNVYVADTNNNTIRKVTPAGVTTTFAGTAGTKGGTDGMGASASFYGPSGIAIDAANNLYVAERYGDTIRKITPDGWVSTLAGSYGHSGSSDGAGSAARFNEPSAVAVDHAGNVYVSDTGNQTIRKITPGGVVSTLAGTVGQFGSSDGVGVAAQFYTPSGLAVDSSGNVYVADLFNSEIRKITPDGTVTRLAGNPKVFSDLDGTLATAAFAGPIGIAIDAAGNLYVSDYVNNANTVRMITTDGNVVTIGGAYKNPGGTDGLGTSAQFSDPNAIAVDRQGNLYIADAGNGAIRKGVPVTTASTGQASAVSVTAGASTNLGVSAAGIGLSYQWSKDGSPIAGATSPELMFDIPTSMDSGSYACVVTNVDGASSTYAASLAVAPSFTSNPAARLVDISTRTLVGTGQNIQTAGISISGTAPKQVLIRASGPALLPFGVTNFLPNPTLTLHDINNGGAVIATNDDWDYASVQSIAHAVGAFNWAEGSKDAAMVVTLNPGLYTAEVSDKDGQSGVSLLEVYEADKTSRTVALSTRAEVQTGQNIGVAGFAISGPGVKTVLIRAAGPALSSFGITNFLPDPVLSVYDLAGNLLFTNDNWDYASVQTVAHRVGAFDWTQGSKDAALIVSLPAGLYTAEVKDANGKSGVALVEVYEAN